MQGSESQEPYENRYQNTVSACIIFEGYLCGSKSQICQVGTVAFSFNCD